MVSDALAQDKLIAMALLDTRQRVMYANVGARRLLNDGQPIQGLHWPALAARQSPAAADALRAFRHGIFEVEDDNSERERYLLSRLQLHPETRDQMDYVGMLRTANRKNIESPRTIPAIK